MPALLQPAQRQGQVGHGVPHHVVGVVAAQRDQESSLGEGGGQAAGFELLLQLHEERYRLIGTYSTGMKQRVKLAQALVGDPRLLLLDEPTNGLDPAGRTAMLELIARIGAEFGISIVVASHLLGEIERICDHLVAIEAGRLLRADTITSFTQASQVLAVEVEEGLAQLLQELKARGLAATTQRDQRTLLVPLGGDDTYDVVRDAVADLALPLCRLEQRRHQVEELFRDEVGAAHV